jgi:hypothetical protein
MKRMAALSILTFIFIFNAGCNDPLPSRALVDDLRVLAVRAEPPEAAPGATITFDALVGDVEVPSRAFRRGWALCTPGVDGVATCGDPGRVTALGTGSTATWTVPDDLLDDLSPDDAAIGRDVYVVFGIELDGLDSAPEEGEHDVAFKRVRISTNPEPNANPVIEALLLDRNSSEAPLPVDVGARTELLVLATQESRQQYMLHGDLEQEDMRYTWLVTRGSIADPVSWGDSGGVSETRWAVPGSGEPDLMLWVVLRDGRGGTAWARQRVELQ